MNQFRFLNSDPAADPDRNLRLKDKKNRNEIPIYERKEKGRLP